MEIVVFAIIAAVVLYVLGSRAGGGSRRDRGAAPDDADAETLRIESALRRHGVRLQTHAPMRGTSPRGVGARYRIIGVDGDGNEVTGEVTFPATGLPIVEISGGALPREVDAADDDAVDPEAEIQREVARRLDAIQGDRAAFLAFDKNGDGKVDAEEWAAARAQVEAEVRATHASAVNAAGGVPTADAPPVRVLAAPVVLDESSVVDDGPGEDSDRQW